MDEIRIFDAEGPLGSMLDAVEAGQDVLVVRNGRPIARLIPTKDGDAVPSAIDGLRALRAGIAARGDTFSAAEIADFRHEGRR